MKIECPEMYGLLVTRTTSQPSLDIFWLPENNLIMAGTCMVYVGICGEVEGLALSH